MKVLFENTNLEAGRFLPTFAVMTATSWFFMLLFAIPLIVLLIWLMKQDKRRGILGIIIVLVLATAAIYVSVRIASRNAAENFELRKKEAQE